MKTSWQKFETSGALRAAVTKKVAEKSEIFSFRSDPHLASLVSCLGLEFELGKSDQDRLSLLLGVDLKKEMWETEIITYQGMIGLRAYVPGRAELTPLHEDFAKILHPLSMENGHLSQLVIFPALVAENYAQRGIELVIVKDWVTTAFLGNTKLNYQRTNAYELESNIALTQMKLLRNRQLAFSGTRDLGDHLLGASAAHLAQYDSLLAEITKTYEEVFFEANSHALVLSYLIAVMLDDLAQPQWYGSAPHIATVKKSLALMRKTRPGRDSAAILPDSFHRLVESIRDREARSQDVSFLRFQYDLKERAGTRARAISSS